MPIPVSYTEISIIPLEACYKHLEKSLLERSSRVEIYLHLTVIEPPYKVNFKAFESKFNRTYYIL